MNEEQQQLVDIINQCARDFTCWEVYRINLFQWYFAGRETSED